MVVANTGDSRLITDDGRGNSKFRQVTTEHRPSNPTEKRRLTECVARGECTLHRSSEGADIRVFPGGLAVCRTIGDGMYCIKNADLLSCPHILTSNLFVCNGFRKEIAAKVSFAHRR